jgi:tetratricopeptide (TPR) repeat protein
MKTKIVLSALCFLFLCGNLSAQGFGNILKGALQIVGAVSTQINENTISNADKYEKEKLETYKNLKEQGWDINPEQMAKEDKQEAWGKDLKRANSYDDWYEQIGESANDPVVRGAIVTTDAIRDVIDNAEISMNKKRLAKARERDPDFNDYYDVNEELGTFTFNYERYKKYAYEKPRKVPVINVTPEMKADDQPVIENADVYHQIENNFHDQGEYADAIDSYKKTIQINPNDTTAYKNLVIVYNNMGVDYYNQEMYIDAINAYQRAIQLDKNNAKLYDNLGIVYYSIGQYVEAIDAYKKAIQLDPNNIKAYDNLGTVYCDQEKYVDAIETYEKVIQIKPSCYASVYKNIGVVYNNWGTNYCNNGQYAEAIEAYKKAARINPNNPMVYKNMGIAYYHQGMYNSAVEAYERAIPLVPNDEDIKKNIELARSMINP